MTSPSEENLLELASREIYDKQSEYSDKLLKKSKELRDCGMMFSAGEHLSKAAELKAALGDEDSLMIAALYYEDAANAYHSINYYEDAAKNIEKAAKIHILLKDYKFAIKCYALAKNYYGDAGDYDNCGLSYLEEMKLKKLYYRSLVKGKKSVSEKYTYSIRYLKYLLFEKTTGYGEKLTNLLYTSILIILIFTAYYFLGQDVTMLENNIDDLFYVEIDFSWRYLYVCLIYSMSLFVGFSTTPYFLVNYNLISAIEVIMGNLVLALFIAVVIRKVSRR